MKTATLLFGLAACAASPSDPQDPHYPLCGADGAPACGNIGQAGRGPERQAPTPGDRPAPAAPVVAATPTTPTPAPASPSRSTRVLLQASSEQAVHQVSATPLVNRQGEVACGNVMSKSGRRRMCRDTTGHEVSDTPVGEPVAGQE